MAIWTTNPFIFVDTRLSSGVLEIPQENAEWLVQTLRRWPGQARYAQAGGYSFAGAVAEGVLSIKNPVGQFYPIWAGALFKTPGRDLLLVSLLARIQTGTAPYRVDIYINNNLAQQTAVTSTSFVTVAGSFAIGAGNGYGVAEGDYYTVAVMAGQTTGARAPAFFTTMIIEGYSASAPGGYPTLPTFTGAGDLDDDDANTTINALSWLFERVAAHKRPGFSGVTQNFFDAATNPDMTNVWIRVANYTARVLGGHRTVRIRGRYEHRGGQTHDMRIIVNGVAVWTETGITGPEVRDPWELDIDVSAVGGLTLTNDGTATIGIDYRRTAGDHYPRPRVTLTHVQLDGAATLSGSYTFDTPIPVLTNFDARTRLQTFRNNVSAAKSLYDIMDVEVEVDLPYAWQWDTPARYAYHPQAKHDELQRLKRAAYNGPAYFWRWGDVLYVYGVRPAIVWGPATYEYTAKGADAGNSQEIATLEQPYRVLLDDNPERAVKLVVYLSAIEQNGAKIKGGQLYSVQADALYYAAEGLISQQV